MEISIGFRSKPDPLAICKVKELTSQPNWAPLPDSQFSVSDSGLDYTVQLAPGQALRVCQELNYTGHQNETVDFTSLHLRGANTERSWQGKAAQAQFHHESGRYLLRWNDKSQTKP